MPVLHVEYEVTAGWAHPILSAILANPILAANHAQWRDLELPDLAFAIETRLGAIDEAVAILSESLRTLSYELFEDPRVEEHIQKGAAFRFRDRSALRRAFLATNTFILESRSTFENLAAFYRGFVAHYFGENIAKPASLETVRQLTPDSAWANELRSLRGDISHGRSPWLEFNVLDGPRKFEPYLLLDWRPTPRGPGDIVPFPQLLALRQGCARPPTPSRSTSSPACRQPDRRVARGIPRWRFVKQSRPRSRVRFSVTSGPAQLGTRAARPLSPILRSLAPPQGSPISAATAQPDPPRLHKGDQQQRRRREQCHVGDPEEDRSPRLQSERIGDRVKNPRNRERHEEPPGDLVAHSAAAGGEKPDHQKRQDGFKVVLVSATDTLDLWVRRARLSPPERVVLG